MKIYKIILCLLLANSFTLTGCFDSKSVDCPEPRIYGIYDLTANELQKVAYTGYDTLYFLSKTGDTNIVVGNGKQYYYYHHTYTSGNPGCPNDAIKQYQVYTIQFKPIKGNFNFSLRQRKELSSTIVIEKENSSFFFSSDIVGRNSNEDIYSYFDSLYINGYKYEKVLKITGFTFPSWDYILFNQSHGVLLMRNGRLNEEYSIINHN